MFQRFGLVLMVNHACNLRCTYCYTGRKFNRTMPIETATRAVDRALASIKPDGALELGFFGGEPLIEAELISNLLTFARASAGKRQVEVCASLTTNGTLASGAAWQILRRADIDLAISFDGTPTVHDRHRLTIDGHGTSQLVLKTIGLLQDERREFRVIVVVRPDNVAALVESISFLRSRGVNWIELSLDLWTTWTSADLTRLQAVIESLSQIWRDGLPNHGINWFDEKAAELSDAPRSASARCGFGHGEIAVAPSGRLYPCERLIGEDRDGDPMQLGHVLDGSDFLSMQSSPHRNNSECDGCAMNGLCNTNCRCSNYVRTSDVRWPDALLCVWNQACLIATASVLGLRRAVV